MCSTIELWRLPRIDTAAGMCRRIWRGDPTSPEEEFAPRFDDDGNQTLIKTATGIWSVTYNGENRPIIWECVSTNSPTPNSSTPTLISMSYDRMGRRVTKNNQRFVYDGYLQIANFELQTSNIKLQTFIWDPTELVATRPLAWLVLRSLGEGGYYTHDGNKNVSEVITSNGDEAAHYEYAPFGALVAQTGDSAMRNPFRFSSEYTDDVLGLAYYNYRHYEPLVGRWMNRDPIGESDILNLFCFNGNDAIDVIDLLGQRTLTYIPPPDSTVTPFELGIEWLTGLGPRHRDFTDGDAFAEQLRQHNHIQAKIKEVSAALTQKCSENCSFSGPYELVGPGANYNLRGWVGVINYLGDYSNLLTFGVFGNLAVTYTGSYTARFTMQSVDCCANVAVIEIVINNRSHAASAFRPPVVGYTAWWQRNVAPRINRLFRRGPMSPTTQRVTLTETLTLSSKCGGNRR